MAAANHPLPDLDALDPNELKALILSQREQLASRDSEIEHLKLLIAKLRRMQFGRKSEKLDRRSSNWSCGWTSWKRRKRRRPLLRKHPAGLQSPLRMRQRNPRDARCQSTCRVKHESIRRSRTLARTAAES